ncbi:hypothetical protein FCJ61_06370 [Burkholderia metallica]|nr:hypothetical protein [Burkholderia metallica]NTZ82633.1 hypothetical protein [Burkholderia metallica]
MILKDFPFSQPERAGLWTGLTGLARLRGSPPGLAERGANVVRSGAICREGRSVCRFGTRFSDRAWCAPRAAFQFDEDASLRGCAPCLAAGRLSRIADAAGVIGCVGRGRNLMKMNSARFILNARGQNDKKE